MENTGSPYCELDGNSHNTGNLVQVQTDMNPCTTTSGQTRQVVTYNPSVCPAYGTCTNCTGPSKKCISGTCQEGTKVYTSSVFSSKFNLWYCTYHYHWSDGSDSADYTEWSAETCIGFGGGGWDG